ncbi:thiamine pyrophosphate-binding protein, partial [Streptomyces sp. 2MCAF27]
QYSERDGQEQRLVPGVWGIFGHGNVAGIGQALLQAAVTHEADLPYYLARNEQGMVHASVAYAKMRDRLATFACTASTGPGSTNMITGAALATTNRLPVLLLPSDMFATRAADPVLQQLEDARGGDVTVNDAFRAVSKYFDRISRPEQLIPAALAAMRVLTDPVETGAVTLALPQDVQAEAFDWPVDFFRRRVWHVGRPVPEPAAIERAAQLLRSARKPLIVAGGGAVYSGAEAVLRAFAEVTGVPVADTHAGKGAVPWDHPYAVGGIGSTGSHAANALAKDADVVLGIGTRYSDFTTASHTVFGNPDVTFVNLNVARLDAVKHSAEPLVADARLGIQALAAALDGWQVEESYRRRTRELIARTREIEDECFAPDLNT